jgi:hypothetical protein
VLLACCWRAAGVLLACCWRAAGVLLACCWRAAGVLLACCRFIPLYNARRDPLFWKIFLDLLDNPFLCGKLE